MVLAFSKSERIVPTKVGSGEPPVAGRCTEFAEVRATGTPISLFYFFKPARFCQRLLHCQGVFIFINFALNSS
jgi:hypothetical protein